MFTEPEAKNCFITITQLLSNSVVNSVNNCAFFVTIVLITHIKINRQFKQVYIIQSAKTPHLTFEKPNSVASFTLAIAFITSSRGEYSLDQSEHTHLYNHDSNCTKVVTFDVTSVRDETVIYYLGITRYFPIASPTW